MVVAHHCGHGLQIRAIALKNILLIRAIGQTNMTIKYKVDWLIPSQGPLTVSKNKIFKIADAGTDNIANVIIEKIIKVN